MQLVQNADIPIAAIKAGGKNRRFQRKYLQGINIHILLYRDVLNNNRGFIRWKIIEIGFHRLGKFPMVRGFAV